MWKYFIPTTTKNNLKITLFVQACYRVTIQLMGYLFLTFLCQLSHVNKI